MYYQVMDTGEQGRVSLREDGVEGGQEGQLETDGAVGESIIQYHVEVKGGQSFG